MSHATLESERKSLAHPSSLFRTSKNVSIRLGANKSGQRKANLILGYNAESLEMRSLTMVTFCNYFIADSQND